MTFAKLHLERATQLFIPGLLFFCNIPLFLNLSYANHDVWLKPQNQDKIAFCSVVEMQQCNIVLLRSLTWSLLTNKNLLVTI